MKESFENYRKKLLKEAPTEAPVAPPKTTPTPTRPAPSTPTTPRRNPLLPPPSRDPKPSAPPKAQKKLSADVIRFIMNGPESRKRRILHVLKNKPVYREKFEKKLDLVLVGEGFDDIPNLNPELKRAINENGFTVEAIFPALNDGEATFLQTLVSDSYEQLCDWASSHLNYNQFTGNIYTLLSVVQRAIGDIVQIEQSSTERLKELALTKFLEQPEYELVNDAYVNDDLEFRLILGDEGDNPDAERIKTAFRDSLPKTNYAGLTDEEAQTLGIANALEQNRDAILQREFANLLISGDATNKFNFFQLFKDELDSINPRLYDLYGLFSAAMQASFYATPKSLYAARNTGGAIGMTSTEGDPDEPGEGNQKRIITAVGVIFPILTHEMAKGIMEYTMEGALPDDAELRKYVLNHADGVDKELLGLLSGGTLLRRIRTKINESHPRLNGAILPLILVDIVKSGRKSIQEILRGSERGDQILFNIIRSNKQRYDDYRSESL